MTWAAMRHVLLANALLAVCSGPGTSSWITRADADDVIDIGSRRELFVDHFLIDKQDGLQLKLQPPAPTALIPNAPRGHYATVIKDGARVSMSCRYLDSLSPAKNICDLRRPWDNLF